MVSRSLIVIARLSRGTPGMNRSIRSPTRSRRIVCSLRIAAAVNCLVIDPMSYPVLHRAGMRFARSAHPKLSQATRRPPRATSTVPLAPVGHCEASTALTRVAGAVGDATAAREDRRVRGHADPAMPRTRSQLA